MKYTNKFSLPEGLVKAVKIDRPTAVDRLSATSILKGVKETVLTKRHWENIEVDVADSIWAVFGTAVHSLLEHEGEQEVTEETLRVKIGEITVSGRLDNYNLETGVISDYKTCSIWKIKFNDFTDWDKQGLIYAWLLNQAGFKATAFRVIAMIKDHSKSQARREAAYPESPVYVREIPITPEALKAIEELIREKIKQYLAALRLGDDDIPECSSEERWAKPDKWAVMKEGRKSAVRVLDSQVEATNMADSLGKGYFVEYRAGISTKCVDYCPVKAFCHFGKMQGDADE